MSAFVSGLETLIAFSKLPRMSDIGVIWIVKNHQKRKAIIKMASDFMPKTWKEPPKFKNSLTCTGGLIAGCFVIWDSWEID
jgi:hypothetical protein